MAAAAAIAQFKDERLLCSPASFEGLIEFGAGSQSHGQCEDNQKEVQSEARTMGRPR